MLRDNKLYLYLSEAANTPAVDEFDLCPTNGEVAVHSAVNAGELSGIATTDLPYILQISFEPSTTCWPGR